ncbi:hypothetical protein CBW65_18665 [Tumebacillus avium]|uniref:Uncharacterized protein n=1 Tax=Tumebacillus avium TaxID=1903704 RepID=A0A1Y0ITF9_9BACL|nr:hypothetical protein [Tumebacillus avium]ARU62765.1 hypothetical protein CBW65_18665 [Tumebacillus avium]
MNNPIALIGSSVLQLVGGNVYIFLFVIVYIGVFLWLYKELRKEDSERTGKVLERFDKTVETLGKLENSLLQYLEGTKDREAQKQMYDLIGSSYPYLQISLIEKIQGIFTDTSTEYGKECIDLIRKEVRVLKNYNEGAVPKLANGELTSWVEQFVAMIISRFVKPAYVALLILGGLYSFVATILISVSRLYSTSQVWEFVLCIIAVCFLGVFIVITITSIADGRWKQFLRFDGPLLLLPPLLGVVLTSGIVARGVSFSLFVGVLLYFYYTQRKNKVMREEA